MRIVIVYAHDCDEHVNSTLALANIIRETLGCEVIIDINQLAQLSANKVDCAYKTIRDADKVLIVHSAGAFYRYQVTLSLYNSTFIF